MKAITHPPILWADVPDLSPGPGEVRLRVHATSVNRADLLQVAGHYPPPPGASPIVGLEAAGVIDAVGPGVVGWRVGDRAMSILAGGGYAEAVLIDARHLLPVPAAMDLHTAGAVPEVFMTAWLNVLRLGGLRAGERVLIHGGSGGVGTAAIQLARQVGAEVWTTAGGPERCARCVALGADVAVDHRDASVDFAARLQDAGGADVVLDVMGAKLLDRNLRALAVGGRLVVIGLQGGRKAEIDLGRLLAARLTLIGSTLRGRSPDDKAVLTAAFQAQVGPWLAEGRVTPLIDAVLPLPEAEAAHRRMAAGEHFGKIVLCAPGT